jgi:hypothetical protein
MLIHKTNRLKGDHSMRTFAIRTLVALVLLAGTAASAQAAPTQASTTGPYEGRFQGTVSSGNGSSAPLSVTLTHKGDTVAGVASLGEGLEVQTPFCGAASVPSRTQYLSGQTQPGQPRNLEATSKFTVEGLPITLRFRSDISADGKTVQGTTTLDLPWFCGGDPVLTGTLHRVA